MGWFARLRRRSAATVEPPVGQTRSRNPVQSAPPSPRPPSPRQVPSPRTATIRLDPPGSATSSGAHRADGGPRRRAQAPWLPPGADVTVHGLLIRGGLLYVGTKLQSVRGWDVEPSSIDPTLKVDLAHPDATGVGLDYWPSYSRLAPAERGGYLRWLAEGRNRPDAPIGFVFIYFYGLERRLLHETSPGDAERSVLLGEVERLLGLYADNYSLRNYASNLLQFPLPIDGAPRYLQPPPVADRSYELPPSTCVVLGQLIADGKPIPAAWAQAWWQQHPETRVRTPVRRCPEQFAAAFAALYTRRYGDGVVVRENKKRLQLHYHAASAGLDSQSLDTALPDVRALRGPVNKFAELAEQATNDLDAYSRYLGRSGADPGSPAALAALPPYVSGEPSAVTTRLLTWIDDALGEQPRRMVPAVELIGRWAANSPDRLNKAEAELLALLLERHGLGIEPDVRFGGASPAPAGQVVLFRLPKGTAVSATAGRSNGEYQAAIALVQLSAAVAAADGIVADAEVTTMLEHVVRGLHLDPAARARLRAHLEMILRQPPTPAALRKRAAALDDRQRQQAAQLLLAVAAADGVISPAEIDRIARLFRVLGFEETDAYAQVHALSTQTGPKPDRLVATRTAGTAPAEFPLPPPSGRGPAGAHAVAGNPAPLQLDPEMLARTRRDSEQVAALLAEIFVDDPADPAPPASHVPAAAPNGDPTEADGFADLVSGLDAAHSALLRGSCRTEPSTCSTRRPWTPPANRFARATTPSRSTTTRFRRCLDERLAHTPRLRASPSARTRRHHQLTAGRRRPAHRLPARPSRAGSRGPGADSRPGPRRRRRLNGPLRHR